MKPIERMPLGVVIERREIDNPWQDYVWCPVALIPGAPEVEEWKPVNSGKGWIHDHAATLPLELHRKETEFYVYNLESRPPVIYVVLRQSEEAGEPEVEPFVVTASPAESQDFVDVGDDIVEAVPMPEVVLAWVKAFCVVHHVPEPDYTRKRTRLDPDDVLLSAPGRRREI